MQTDEELLEESITKRGNVFLMMTKLGLISCRPWKITISLHLSQTARYGSLKHAWSFRSCSDVIWFKTETYIFDIRLKCNQITVDQRKADGEDFAFILVLVCLFACCFACFAEFKLIRYCTTLTALAWQLRKVRGTHYRQNTATFFHAKASIPFPVI